MNNKQGTPVSKEPLIENAMSAANEEHATTVRKEDEHIEHRQDNNAAKANAADSIEHGTAAGEEFEETSQFCQQKPRNKAIYKAQQRR